MVEIVEVESKKMLKKFVQFPLDLYKANPYYVPSFWGDEIGIKNPKKNPACLECDSKMFLAVRDKKVVGRIMGIINPVYNEKVNQKFVRFSRIDMIDDQEVATALLTAVEDYGRANGMEKIHGPWGFNDTDREGMLCMGFDKISTFVTMYSSEYYLKLVENNGYEKEVGWDEFFLPAPKEVDSRLQKLAEYSLKRYELRIVEGMKTKALLARYGGALFDVINEAYRDLYGVVPITESVKEQILSAFGAVIQEKYMCVVVDKNDKLVGCGVAFPSMAKAVRDTRGKLFPFGFLKVLKEAKKPKRLELAMVAVKDEYRNKGLNAAMITKIVKAGIEAGLEGADTNPELETNSQVRAFWNYFEGVEHTKSRKTYIKTLQEKQT